MRKEFNPIQFILDALVRMPIDEGTTYAKEHGFSIRIVKEDHKPKVVTRDYNESRINVEVYDGHIAEIQGIG